MKSKQNILTNIRNWTCTKAAYGLLYVIFRRETCTGWALCTKEKWPLRVVAAGPGLHGPPPSHLSHQHSHSLLTNPLLKLNSTPPYPGQRFREREHKDIRNPDSETAAYPLLGNACSAPPPLPPCSPPRAIEPPNTFSTQLCEADTLLCGASRKMETWPMHLVGGKPVWKTVKVRY